MLFTILNSSYHYLKIFEFSSMNMNYTNNKLNVGFIIRRVMGFFFKKVSQYIWSFYNQFVSTNIKYFFLIYLKNSFLCYKLL